MHYLFLENCTVSRKKHAGIFSCNLSTHFPIWIIFGKNISWRLGNPKVVYFFTSLKRCFCTTLPNRRTQNCIFSLNVVILFCWKLQKHIYCLSIVWFRCRNSLQQMFEVSSLRANTRLQTLSPLADSSVDAVYNTLLHKRQSVAAEFVDIVDLHLVHTLLHESKVL